MTLDQAMRDKGMTDNQLADAVGVSKEAVRLWRSGQRRISPDRLAAVSSATGVTIAELRPDLARAFTEQSVAASATHRDGGACAPNASPAIAFNSEAV